MGSSEKTQQEGEKEREERRRVIVEDHLTACKKNQEGDGRKGMAGEFFAG